MIIWFFLSLFFHQNQQLIVISINGQAPANEYLEGF